MDGETVELKVAKLRVKHRYQWEEGRASPVNMEELS
jgi:hypothetical protein